MVVVGGGTAVGMEAGTVAGTVAGGTVVGGMEAIGIVGAGGLASAGAGGVGAAGIPTPPGVNTLTVTTAAATAATTVILPAPTMKPQRFNQGSLTSVSITGRSTVKSVRRQKVPLKLSRPSTV